MHTTCQRASLQLFHTAKAAFDLLVHRPLWSTQTIDLHLSCRYTSTVDDSHFLVSSHNPVAGACGSVGAQVLIAHADLHLT